MLGLGLGLRLGFSSVLRTLYAPSTRIVPSATSGPQHSLEPLLVPSEVRLPRPPPRALLPARSPCVHSPRALIPHSAPSLLTLPRSCAATALSCAPKMPHPSIRFALRRQTGFPHLNHQANKATLSFYRVVGILLPVLMLFVACRQHHTARSRNRAVCVAPWPIGPMWAKMGLLSEGALEAVLHRERKHPLCVYLLGMSLGSS